MKKMLILFALAFVVFACSRKTLSTAEKAPENEAPAASTTADANSIAQGKRVYTNRCGRCHGSKPVQKYTAQEWEPILTVMIRKARLNETDSATVRAYVLANAKKS